MCISFKYTVSITFSVVPFFALNYLFGRVKMLDHIVVYL